MNITLIGMSGVGKSQIGKLLSRELDYSFIDIDRIIEKDSDKKLQELLDSLGNEGFLSLEEKAIIKLDGINNSVISPGGSSIYSDAAMKFLKRISKVVFLHASLEIIKKRAVNFSVRGIVGLKEKGLEKVFEERLPLYKRFADFTIEINSFNDEVVVGKIIQKIF
jgi:shikimate kinase